ncbi:MAG TPA: cysteine hydrolase [Thermodesulfobacteriota bacterium]|nr:cysteine hydrolase [Thermodesulfobacteriota bacterium]
MDPNSVALIVVDMNRAHLDIALNYLPVAPEDSRRILKNVAGKVIPLFRERRRPIIFVKTVHRVHPETGQPFSVMSPFWKFQMEKKAVSGVGRKRETKAVAGSTVTELMPELDVRPEDFIVVKQRYSPFLGTDLEIVLRTLGIKTVVLVGVNTNNCVLCTAFEAFNRDFAVILLEDCCASMNGPKFHDTAVEQIRTSLGWVSSSDKVDAILNGTFQLS